MSLFGGRVSLSVHRSQPDRRSVASRVCSPCVCVKSRRATHVRAPRLYARMCTPARALARYDRVHGLGAQIQRAELVHRTVEKAEDRIDSPVMHRERERGTHDELDFLPGARILRQSLRDVKLREKNKASTQPSRLDVEDVQQDPHFLIFYNFSDYDCRV